MKWLHFILSHSIFVAVCAVGLAFQTGLLLKLDINIFVYGFTFFATICSYNFYWIISKLSFANNSDITAILKKQSTGVFLLCIATIGLLYCWYMYLIPVHFVITAVLLTVIYSIPLLPLPFLKFTRKAGVLKTILLAFTWTFVTAVIPIQKDYGLLNNADLFIISRRFLFMLMLCIIFDNRDKDIDKIRGLHSLATVLKPAVLKMVIFFIFALLFISNFLYGDYDISFKQSIALQVSTVALLIVYFYSLKKRSYLFYYFIVDGLMLFSAVATFIASI